MFTGIVSAVGIIDTIDTIDTIESLAGPDGAGGSDAGRRLRVAGGGLPLGDVSVGESIAVNGCCLTVVELGGGGFAADVSAATLGCTNLGGLEVGARVNLEKAVAVGERIGGHLVTGHVDGTGEVIAQQDAGESRRLRLRMPEAVAPYVAVKGSISIDGVSLTVNEVSDGDFTVNLIPHTLQATTLGDYEPGRRVNLEADLIARYLARLCEVSALGAPHLKNTGGLESCN